MILTRLDIMQESLGDGLGRRPSTVLLLLYTGSTRIVCTLCAICRDAGHHTHRSTATEVSSYSSYDKSMKGARSLAAKVEKDGADGNHAGRFTGLLGAPGNSEACHKAMQARWNACSECDVSSESL